MAHHIDKAHQMIFDYKGNCLLRALSNQLLRRNQKWRTGDGIAAFGELLLIYLQIKKGGQEVRPLPLFTERSERERGAQIVSGVVTSGIVGSNASNNLGTAAQIIRSAEAIAGNSSVRAIIRLVETSHSDRTGSVH